MSDAIISGMVQSFTILVGFVVSNLFRSRLARKIEYHGDIKIQELLRTTKELVDAVNKKNESTIKEGALADDTPEGSIANNERE